MSVSRCVALAVLLTAGTRSARIAKARQSTNSAEETEIKDCYSGYDGKALMRLSPCNTTEVVSVLEQLEQHGCVLLNDWPELLAMGCADAEVVCDAETAASLLERKAATVIDQDAGALWRGVSGFARSFNDGLSAASDFYSAWRDLDAQIGKVESIVANSGGIATLETVGKTVQGRDMKIVRFRGQGYAPGGIRHVVTFNMHAREWITGMSGVYAVEQLVAKVSQDPSYLNGVEVVLMPMANPDGFYYSTTTDRMHRKNMANENAGCPGVDINRNWDAHWASGGSSGSQCQDTYHGPSAASEPETKVIGNVIMESQTTVYVDVHAYSQLIISAYGWTSARHPREAEYSNIRKKMQAAVRTVGGNTWTEGPIAQVLYTASGSSVDYASDVGALGICLELRPGRSGGGGFAPSERDILIGAQESYAAVLAGIDYSKAPDATPAPTPPTPAPCRRRFWGCR